MCDILTIMEESFMDQKKVNLTLIFSLIMFAIGIAVKSLANYFGGFGIPFVAVIVFAVLMIVNGFVNSSNRRRLWDMFILAGVSLIFALVAYCSYDWVNQLELTIKDIEFVNEWCIAYSIFSTIFLIYGLLRYVSEISDKKWTIFEIVLGLKRVEKKTKLQERYNRQPKDVASGDFEEKPTHVQEERIETPKENVEQEVKESETVETDNETVETSSNTNYNQY